VGSVSIVTATSRSLYGSLTGVRLVCTHFLDGGGDVFHHRGISPTYRFSHTSGTCPTGFWDDNLRHHGHHFSKPLSTYGEDTRILSCAQGARGEEGVLYFGDSGDKGDGLDVVRLRVGMGSGILSHSNIGTHLMAMCRAMLCPHRHLRPLAPLYSTT
jgi:hypothetical protein